MIVRIPLHGRSPCGVRMASNVFLLSGIVILLIVLWSEMSSARYQATQARPSRRLSGRAHRQCREPPSRRP